MQKVLFSIAMMAMLGFGFSQLSLEAGGGCESLCRACYQADMTECDLLSGSAKSQCTSDAFANYSACVEECNSMPNIPRF